MIEVLETPFFSLTKIILEEKMAFFQIFSQNWYVFTVFLKKNPIFLDMWTTYAILTQFWEFMTKGSVRNMCFL